MLLLQTCKQFGSHLLILAMKQGVWVQFTAKLVAWASVCFKMGKCSNSFNDLSRGKNYGLWKHWVVILVLEWHRGIGLMGGFSSTATWNNKKEWFPDKEWFLLDFWQNLLCSYLVLHISICMICLMEEEITHTLPGKVRQDWFSGLSDLFPPPGDVRPSQCPSVSSIALVRHRHPQRNPANPLRSGSWSCLQGFPGVFVSFCCILGNPKAQWLKITPSLQPVDQQLGLRGQFLYGPTHALAVSWSAGGLAGPQWPHLHAWQVAAGYGIGHLGPSPNVSHLPPG